MEGPALTELIVSTGRRKVERRKDIRNRLLTAIEQLAADGEPYSTVTVERLVSAAGISRATFYIYFEGKADLLQTWFTETMRELAEAAEPWRAITAQPTEAELAAALNQIISAYVEHAGLMAAVYDEATQNSALRESINSAIRIASESVCEHIERGQREGWVDPELLAPETASWLVWMLERGLNQLVPDAKKARANRLKLNLASMVWHVLYAGASGKPARRPCTR